MGYPFDIKLTATLKLKPTDEQRQMLYDTLERANAACNWISQQARQAQTFGRVPVHHLTYDPVRNDFDLAAQLVVRCIGKVVDAYKQDKQTQQRFRKLGSVPYDSRILNYRLHDQVVSIWAAGGREVIPFVTGEHQLALLQHQQGESDLVHHKGAFYLYATCEVPDEAEINPEGWLGVDLGIVNLAVDSDGTFHQGKGVKNVRHRHRTLRQRLQQKQTDSARRKLKKLSGKEARFAKDINHTISKRIVEKAQRHSYGIALENLKGIRERITVRRAQRATLHSWSFHQLCQHLTYKAQRAGLPVVLVDPRNTSRTCPNCGDVDKRNRPTQDQFLCIQCGCAGRADYFAAVEISRRAAFNPPNAAV